MDDLKEKLQKLIADNIALFDCPGGCPDEIAINPKKRTDEYCDSCFTGQLLALVDSAGYRRLPEGNHLLPDSDRREIIDYLLKSMPGRWKRRDIIETCVRTMSQVCQDKLRGERCHTQNAAHRSNVR